MKCFPIDIIMLSLAITSYLHACMQIRMILVVTILDVSSFWQSHSFIHSFILRQTIATYVLICIWMCSNGKVFVLLRIMSTAALAHTHKLAGFLAGSIFYLFNNPICLPSLSYLPLKQLQTAWMQNLLSNIADDLNGLRMLRMTCHSGITIKYCSFWHATQLWNQIKWSTLPSRASRTNFQNSSSYISYGCYSSWFQCFSIIFPLIC